MWWSRRVLVPVVLAISVAAALHGAVPGMGWNNCQIDCATWAPDDALIRSTALQLNHLGLVKAGYTLLNLDDAWMGDRTSDGLLQPNITRFPDFNATLAFARSLGLQIGLYVAAGDKTCSGRPGSCNHEISDAAQFVNWGIAHVKDDACSTCRDPRRKGAPEDYAVMAASLKQAAAEQGTLPPLLMVEGQPPFPLAADGLHGDVRRVGHDINAKWLSMLSLVDIGSGLWMYAKPGFFNDLEMMELGNGDFVAEQGDAALARSRAHMTMWAIMKSPLVLSTNLSALGPQTLAVATNALAIMVNQDPLGAQARRVKSTPPAEGGHPLWPPRSSSGALHRRDARDIAAAAAPCNSRRATQRWRWSSAVDSAAPVNRTGPAPPPQNGTLWTTDAAGFAWCLAMPTSGIWSVVPYAPGNASHPSACVDQGSVSSWRALPAANPTPNATRGENEDEFAFVWRNGDRPYGFAWGQDPGSSGPLPHTRWLQSNPPGGNWVGDLAAASEPTSRGVPFSPATASVLDDNHVGKVTTRPGSEFCLDIVSGGNVETWAAPLEGGRSAVAVLNRSPVAQCVVVEFTEVLASLSPAPRVGKHRFVVRSAWGEEGTNHGDSYRCHVPAHGAALLVLEPDHDS